VIGILYLRSGGSSFLGYGVLYSVTGRGNSRRLAPRSGYEPRRGETAGVPPTESTEYSSRRLAARTLNCPYVYAEVNLPYMTFRDYQVR
jgi:hypothetical protein